MFNVDEKYIYLNPVIPYFLDEGFKVYTDTNWSAYYPNLDRRGVLRNFYQTFESCIDLSPNHRDTVIGTKVLADQLPFRPAIAPIICYIDRTSYYYPKGGKKVPSLLLSGLSSSPILVFTNQSILSQLEHSNRSLEEHKQSLLRSDTDLFKYMQALNPWDDSFYMRIEKRHADFPMITYIETNKRLFTWKSEYDSTDETLRRVKPKDPKVIAFGNVTCSDPRVSFTCISPSPEFEYTTRDIKRSIESLIGDADCAIFSKAAVEISLPYIWLNSYNGHTKTMTKWGLTNTHRPFDPEIDQMVLYKNGTTDGPIMAAPLR